MARGSMVLVASVLVASVLAASGFGGAGVAPALAASPPPSPHTYPSAGPNDPNYAPVERAYAASGPAACLRNNVNDEQHYLYSFEPACAPNAADPGGAAGMSVDRAWHHYTIGDPRVVMAYIEGGINWFDPQAKDLQNQVYLNTGELPLPEDAGGDTHPNAPDHGYDLNGDGVVNVQDYAQDPRVHDVNHNGYLDAEDLIATFSSWCNKGGTWHRDPVGCKSYDSDGDGFAHDISGWDFYDHQNDPATYDSTYDHSDNQMLQAGAEGNNSFAGVGVCPGCLIMPIKAGAEALDRTDNLAQAWLYACHAGVKVIISVTADLGYSSYMNQAINYCWQHGVVMVEASNDFDSLDHQGGMFHPYVLPGNGEVPNTFGYDTGGTGALTDAVINADTTTFVERSDETSWGTHAMFSAATSGGSTSESTPTVGGAFGLLLSWGAQAADKGYIHGPLTGQEAIQVMRATATPITSAGLPWPGTPGEWNDQYGYGRPNLDAAMAAVAAGDIPPVGWITSPAWYSLYDPSRAGTLTITGHLAAPRSPSYRWALQYGLTPPRSCADYSTEPATWTTIGTGAGTNAFDGTLGTLDLSKIPASFYAAPYALSRCKQYETNDQYTLTLRLTVTDASGRVALDRRAIAVHHDSTQLPGFPLPMAANGGTKPGLPGMTIDGTSQPAYADLQGRGDLALVYGDADGYVHALDPATGQELPGWPVHTDATVPDHSYPGIDPGHEPVLAPVAVGDLTHSGRLDVVVTSTTGRTYVWNAFGHLLAGWPKTLDAAAVTPAIPRPRLSFTRLPQQGATASPVLVDLTGDGALDVVQAGWDGDLYAWTAGGAPVPGWPVHVNGAALRPPSGYIKINDAKIDTTPAVAYLDGTGKPDIVVGSQYDFATGAGITEAGYGTTFAYNAAGKPLAGWPVSLPAVVVYYGSAQEYLTEGSTAPVAAPVSGSTDSVAVSPGIFSVTYLLDAAGRIQAVYGPAPTGLTGILEGAYDPTQLAGGNLPTDAPVTFTASGAFGKFSATGDLGYAQPGPGGASVATALLLNGSGGAIKQYERGYNAATGAPEPGFPAPMQGLDFLGEPLIAPVTASGPASIIDGADSSTLHAFSATGQVAGFPKFTTGWVIFSPSAGDALSTGADDLAATTREGYLELWSTPGSAAGNTEWWTYHHDEWRTGRYGVDSRPPGTLRDVHWTPGARTATFVAPGDNWYAGTVAGYHVAIDGTLSTVAPQGAAGSVQSLTIPAGAHHVVVQAYDRAGNLGPAINLAVANGRPAGGAGGLFPTPVRPGSGALATTGGTAAPAWVGLLWLLAAAGLLRIGWRGRQTR